MTTNIRILSTVLALGAAALSFSAAAQTTDTAPKEGIGQKTEDAAKNAGAATKRGVKKAGHATANVAHKAAGGVRHVGEKIGSKLPPAPHDEGLNGQGVPRVTNQ